MIKYFVTNLDIAYMYECTSIAEARFLIMSIRSQGHEYRLDIVETKEETKCNEISTGLL